MINLSKIMAIKCFIVVVMYVAGCTGHLSTIKILKIKTNNMETFSAVSKTVKYTRIHDCLLLLNLPIVFSWTDLNTIKKNSV